MTIAAFLPRVLFVCLAILFAQAVTAAPVLIDLRATAQVAHAQVTLGDVAVLSGADAATLLQWRGMPLGAAPRTGAVTLARDQIERWIKRHAGSRQPELQWRGAAQVEVSAAQQKVAGDQIAEVARNSLQQWLDTRTERNGISELSQTRDIAVPPGQLRLIVREPAEEAPRKHMLMWVDVMVDGAFVQVVPVTFVVQAYRSVYVARQDMRTGRVAQDREFDSREIDVTQSPAAPVVVLSDAAAATAWRMKHAVARGGVLLKNQIEEAPAVARGESATLRSQVGMLTVESKVEVLQDGYPGQMVKVRASASSGPVLARVASAGLLEMAEK